MRRPLTGAATVLVILSLACGPQHVRTTAIFSEQIGSSALLAQRVVTDLHAQGAIGDESYRQWQTGFLKLGLGLKTLNQGLREADGQTVLIQVSALVGVLDGLVQAEVPKLRPADQTTVLVALTAVRAVLLSIAANWGTP